MAHNQQYNDIEVVFVDHVNAGIRCDAGIANELNTFFSFRPEGYQFSPAFKNKMWDGYIRVFNAKQRLIPVGLIPYVKAFASDRGYSFLDDTEYSIEDGIQDDYGYQLASEFPKYKLRDYQNQYIVSAIRDHRSLSLSPTSSGKSLMIFLIAWHYINAHDENILIVVPTTGLVAQMFSDFVDYGMDPSMMHQIQGGSDKTIKRRITVATWQSLIKMPRKFFDRFGVVIGDEAHKFTAKSLTTIMSYLNNCKYRHGFTGTIKSDSKVNKLVLEGVFGKVRRFTTTSELIKDGTVAAFDIKAMLLHHPEDRKKELKTLFKAIPAKKRYAAEREYIVNNNSRNVFIKNLVQSLNGQNVLVLFDLVDKHGKVLNALLKETGLQVHYIHGGVKAEERERIRQLIDNDDKERFVITIGETELHLDPGTIIGNRSVEELEVGDEIDKDFIKRNLLAKARMPSTNVISKIEFKKTPNKVHVVLASYGTTSTGWSCKRIDAVVFAFAGKAEITTLQSIGRGLRKGNGSDVVTLYDISDSLLPGTSENYTLSHFKKRLSMYSSEKFKFKIYEIDLPTQKAQ